ncbi:MAG: type I restriction endonuclease subunit R [Bacteroidetes bacterium]|jgi:type I restriction enzyme R subunit|nr:type I restriction endonuclease subunit R [Bacteroidota bacterium]
MSTNELSEDQLIQQTVANYFHHELKWESVYAFNDEVLGRNGTLGRESEREVVLTRYLRAALEQLNPSLPAEAYDSAVTQITEISAAQSLAQANRTKYELFKKGVPVSIRNPKGEVEVIRLRVFNFDDPTTNHFLVVRELWVQGSIYRRRPDIVGFVNGIPLLFIELKAVHKDIRQAYEKNLSDYKDTIPHLLTFNSVIVLSNGLTAKVGSVTSKFEHFHEWKRLAEEDAGIVDMETLQKGVCEKSRFMDIFENFILFDDSTPAGLIKILGRNHQVLGVNRAIDAVRRREELGGKLGVFWHTQGAGKSYSMVFFTQKIHRKISSGFTFLVVTDRDDLDKQIYRTFAGCGIVDNKREKVRANSGAQLQSLLKEHRPYLFTLIQKFNKDVDPAEPYSTRADVVVISDEAHRTQYGRLAVNMRSALPNAHYIGFTGTPLFKSDEITRMVFGDYVSTFDFQRAVDDNATVPLYYDNRGEKLKLTHPDINARFAEKLQDLQLDVDQEARLERELGRDYQIMTAESRLDAVARDMVEHYTERWESGKAMLVCIDKITTVRMYNLVRKYWEMAIANTVRAIRESPDEQELVFLNAKQAWLESTEIAVVISEEQGEVQRFREWDLDIEPHRKKIKDGYESQGGKTVEIDMAFKDPNHPFRLAIVCAMWMTGFDVPSLATLYLDKPLQAHTLMQAIARANRVNEGKPNGLVVDYCGILKQLREALAIFAGGEGTGTAEASVDPVKPQEQLLGELAETCTAVGEYFQERGYDFGRIRDNRGYGRIAEVGTAKEIVNASGESRKRFEVLARQFFVKFKAAITIEGVKKYRFEYDAVNAVYRSLQKDRDDANITSIIRELHKIVDEAVVPLPTPTSVEKGTLYDISKIDFDRLRKEFAKHPRKNTITSQLKDVIEERLRRMIERNPLRTDFDKRYQEIIAQYNLEKDRVTTEQTFATLLRFVDQLDAEERRAVREGLDEESLSLFDILEKPNLSKRERERLKGVARDLLDRLKKEYLRVQDWREKEQTRSGVKSFIHDFLWNEETGLPTPSYSPDDVEIKSDSAYQFVYGQYPQGTMEAA